MFYLKNQIILVVLLCIFSNLTSGLNEKDINNDEDQKKFLTLVNDLYIQPINNQPDLLENDDFLSNVMMIKKSNLKFNDNEQLNSLINSNDWQPINWQPSTDTSIEMADSSEQSNKKSAKKSLNYLRSNQPKRTIYRPIRAQRCLKRGSLCDPGSNPIINCCTHSVCRCNFWGDQCRCDRMSLLQKWGK